MRKFSAEDILEQLPEVYICWKDEHSVFLGCNQNFADLIGKSKDEIVGMHDPHFKHCKDDEEVRRTQAAKIEMQETIEDTIHGTIRIKTNKAPLKDSQGRTVGTLVIFYRIAD